MSRRRLMMAEKKLVNLFDKNSGDIVFNARLSGGKGDIFTGDDVSKISFVSHYISVIPLETYVLIRKIIYSDITAYNRWSFFDLTKNYVSQNGSIIETNTIQIPENCYYIRFNGLIEDIDNVKFYKV